VAAAARSERGSMASRKGSASEMPLARRKERRVMLFLDFMFMSVGG